MTNKQKKKKKEEEKGPLLIFFIPFLSHFKFSSSPFTISLLFLFIFPFSLPLFSLSSSFFLLPSKIFSKLSKGGHLAHPKLCHWVHKLCAKKAMHAETNCLPNQRIKKSTKTPLRVWFQNGMKDRFPLVTFLVKSQLNVYRFVPASQIFFPVKCWLVLYIGLIKMSILNITCKKSISITLTRFNWTHTVCAKINFNCFWILKNRVCGLNKIFSSHDWGSMSLNTHAWEQACLRDNRIKGQETTSFPL